eukprot:scaffold37526_cov59-Cyclotella_meneghiniana.AAC.4
MNRLQMLLARLSPKHRSGSSYQSIFTSCARNIIKSTGNQVAVRLVASSHIFSCLPAASLGQSSMIVKSNFDPKGSFRQIPCRSIARVGPSSVFDCQKTLEYVKIFTAGYSNFDLRGPVRFYRRHNRVDFRDCETVDDALQLALEEGETLYPDHIAAMWSSIFRLLSKGQQNKFVHKEDVAQLELLIWDVLEVTMDSLPRMRPKDLTTIIIQLAKISNRVSSRHYKRLSASELALKNILFDEESNPQYSIFDPLAEAANQIIIEFEPRYLSNLAYAYSLLGYNPRFDNNTKLLDNIADASLDCIQQFNAYDIANMMWAYTKMNVSHEPLFQVVGDSIAKKDNLKTFKPQDLSNTVWAYATANSQHTGLFKKVGDEIDAMDNLKSFDPQALANIIWAYATASVQHPALFNKVGDEIVAMEDLKSFNPQNLANTIWSYATANVQHPDLFQKVGVEIVAMNDLKSFKPQELINIVWAYATANEQHPALFKKVANEIAAMDNWESFNSQDLANIAWAYTVANIHTTSLFNSAFREGLLKYQNEFIDNALSQLYQWHLWQTKENSNSNDGLPDSLRDKCKQSFLSADTRASILQNDVVSELKSIGLNPVEEYLTKSGYSIDAFVEVNGKKVGVEVDGPSHFIGRQPNGRTLLKRRQVESIDRISLLSVPYWEWINLGKDRDKKQKYLLSTLKSA